jgi:choice-of-anchor C domain-containing protein
MLAIHWMTASVVLLACTPKTHADLIVNGGFENGPNPNAFTQLDVGSTAITGWVVTRDAIDYCGTIWPAAEGMRSIDLAPSGVNGAGGIAQTFATVSGREYLVQFDMAGNPGFGVGDGIRSLRVSAAGQSADFSFDTTGHTLADLGWVTRSWSFVATGPATTLEFFSLDAPEVFGPTLDNVSVQEAAGVAPEPAGFLLLGVGAVSVLGYSWRRRNSNRSFTSRPK